MENFRGMLFKELVKKGYSEFKGRRIWDIANRSFLYGNDELAKKFLEFRSFPRYKKTIVDIEVGLIKDNAGRFLSGLGEDAFNLIDMGCGDGSKAIELIRELDKSYKIRFCPIHINEYLINLALDNIKKEGFESVKEFKSYVSYLDSFDEVADLLRDKKYKRNVVLLLGSILASFEIHSYLFKMSQAMHSGDYLIIGNSIRTGERFSNLELYKSSVFENWFRPIIIELGFENNEVDYDARFENGRVELFFKVKVNKSLEHDGKKFYFKKGDEIVAAVLYKYYEYELKDFCRMYFRDVEIAVDVDNEHSLILCRK